MTPARSTARRSRGARACSSTRARRSPSGQQLNEGNLYPHELLSHGGETALERRTRTETYIVDQVQEVYKSQGVDINDKHIEVIVRQMLKKVRVDQKGDTDYLPGQFIDRHEFRKANGDIETAGGEPAQFEPIILGITKASLATDSFLSAASFQETTKVLTDAALEGKIDRLAGLKENVIIGKLIPAATGLKRYRTIEIEPSEPLPRGMDDVGLLEGDDLAAELGLTDGDGLGGFGPAFDTAELDEINRLLRLRRRLVRRPRRHRAPAGRQEALVVPLRPPPALHVQFVPRRGACRSRWAGKGGRSATYARHLAVRPDSFRRLVALSAIDERRRVRRWAAPPVRRAVSWRNLAGLLQRLRLDR